MGVLLWGFQELSSTPNPGNVHPPSITAPLSHSSPMFLLWYPLHPTGPQKPEAHPADTPAPPRRCTCPPRRYPPGAHPSQALTFREDTDFVLTKSEAPIPAEPLLPSLSPFPPLQPEKTVLTPQGWLPNLVPVLMAQCPGHRWSHTGAISLLRPAADGPPGSASSTPLQPLNADSSCKFT